MSDRAYANVQAQQKTVIGSSSKNSLLQRTCACGQHTGGGDCTDCRKKREGVLQRHAAISNEPTTVPPLVSEVLRSPGQPLDAATRTFMEPRFGHDFSGVRVHSSTTPRLPARLAVGAPHDRFEQEADAVADRITHIPAPLTGSRIDFSSVRIHTDAKAAESARQINAQAFTVGNHIVFDAGEYAPQTVSGQGLMAHELAHVVQQTGHMASGDKAQRSFIEQRLTSPRLQGKWRLDRVTPDEAIVANHHEGNGDVWSYAPVRNPLPSGGVYVEAATRQEQGIVHQKVGGVAQIARWATKHFIFKNDGADGDFLRLSPVGQLAGHAKAEDLRYARASAVVWGNVTERTAAIPTPPSKELFEIEGGGISAATVGNLGEVVAELPIGERGSVRITIPLTKVDQGEFAPFNKAEQPPHDVPSTVDEVDVLLGAHVAADADIETAFTGISPLISQNENKSEAHGVFRLGWESRPEVGTGSKRSVAPTAEQTRDCVTNHNLDETARPFIGRCCKGSINTEFPEEMYNKTLREIKNGKTLAHKKAWKLLNRKEYRK